MAINNAKAKAKPRKTTRKTTPKKTTKQASKTPTRETPISSSSDRAVALRLYVKDKDLLREAKIAAIEDDTSLSQLWEEWVRDWLEKR